MKRFGGIPTFLALALYMLRVDAQDTMEVGLMIASKGQRAVFYSIAKQFETLNPTLKINYVSLDDGDYKLFLERRLMATRQFDVLYWQAGNRLFKYIEQDLILAIDDLWQSEQWDNSFPHVFKKQVSYQGKVYALPTSYYHWGFYYNKSLFDKLKLQAPTTWQDFLLLCEKLKAHGITPIIMGNNEQWPVAAWFDYLNLRINGLGFHQDLMKGKVSYIDSRVEKVLSTWKGLIENGFFNNNTNDIGWKVAVPYIYHGFAGVILMGNFIESHLPPSLINNIGFFRFPIINKNLPYYEEAPLEIFIIPKNVKYKKEAKKFLAFLATPDIQAKLNQGVGYIPPNVHAEVNGSYLVKQGAKIIGESQGLTQYYDRDTSEEMGSAGLKIFSKFIETGDIEETRYELEKARKAYFNESLPSLK